MRADIQFKIKENPNYLRYLRQNPNWYKLLNRSSDNFKLFEEEVKREYKLTKTDRLSKTLDTIDMLERVLSSLK